MPLPIAWSKLAPQDILDVAAFIEREAQERYLLFADHLDRQGQSEGASFFRLMAALEGVHGAQVRERRAARFADLPGHVRDAVEWDVEGPDLDRNVTSLSLSDAFAMALASEERARDFFAEACDYLVDARTRDMLAELHRDEVSHVRMLQEMRAKLLPRTEGDLS